MKAFIFLIILLITAIFNTATRLQAAPSLSITEPPVRSYWLDGPMIDPGSTNGQWFIDLNGIEEHRTHEFHDNTQDGGGSSGSGAIAGYIVQGSIIYDATGTDIIGFKIEATIHNDTDSADGVAIASDNSHGEIRPDTQEFYRGTLVDTKLTVEFAIADINLLPINFSGPYNYPGQPSWIIADDEDQRGWYCWNPMDPPQGDEAGRYYVPTWDFHDIAVGQSATRTLTFSVSPAMTSSDPRHSIIHIAEQNQLDVFANRTSSLKISTWIDDIGIDYPGPEGMARDSDVSVFHTIEVEGGYDFGDAPDPLAATPGEYPTLLINNGARHRIVAGAPWFGDPSWSESDCPDPEGDGQPDPQSMGDDNNGLTPNDEDGIVIPGLTQGYPSSIIINVGQPGQVDGWIDWNADGKWGAAERVIGQFLLAGANSITVITPNGATIGQTFARFRIHSPDGIALGPIGAPTQFGATDDGEVEDHLVNIVQGPFSDAKWLQPPDLSNNGFDVACRMHGDPPILLADDFLCTQTGPITNIVVWGSWLSDKLPEGNQSNVMFTLSFHTDRPAGTAQQWSIPGSNLWVRSFGPGQFSVEPITFDGMQEGWYDPSDPLSYTPFGDTVCWQYTFPINLVDAFVQTGTVENPVVYWLDVQSFSPWDPDTHFGWKTTPPEYRWNDDAVWTPNLEPYNGVNWFDLHYPLGHAYQEWAENSFDLAFALFGSPQEENLDWGDAPDPSYPTLAASGGASHLLPGTGVNPILGNMVDPEPDGQPSPLADGDDLDILYPSAGDDEDGVTFLTPLIPGTVAQVAIVANGPSATAYLQGWIDFNGNGSWADAGDQIFLDISLATGNNTLTFPVPLIGSSVPFQSYARFRYSSTRGLTFSGAAQDGEVEDYQVNIEPDQNIDWGDAPDNPQGMIYPTLLTHNGAHHIIVPNLFLGGLIDPEIDGQPNASATGDDNLAIDDEDGVWLTSRLMPGGYAGVDVIASQPGILDAWVDFEGNSTWVESSNRIFTGQPLTTGVNSLIFPVPVTAVPSKSTYARFRFTSGGAASYTGLALDGEVEDYVFNIESIEEGIDFGDAPDPTYPTTIGSGGASHTISPGVMLGALIDPEPDGQPTAAADGDDIAAMNDEDGITFTTKIISGSNATVNVVAGVSGGMLDAWIDFTKDGDWYDAGEKIFAAQPVTPGLNTLNFTVPQPSALGTTYARFRISTGGTPLPTGLASDGEVEDYRIELYQPAPSATLVITNLMFNALYTAATVEWTVENGITYQMESTTNLVTGPWIPAGSPVIGPLNSQNDSISTDSNKFYRVTVPWTP